MNAPGRFELFSVPEGVQPVLVEKDSKQQNFVTITVQREDHTLGNLLASHLSDNKHVSLAAYRVPHPLENKFLLQIQTKSSGPVQIVRKAAEDLLKVIGDLKTQLSNEKKRISTLQA